MEVDLSKAIQIPEHSPITLRIEGGRRWPASCRINVLAIRQFNGKTLDFHCKVEPEDFNGNRSFLPEGDRGDIMRFFLSVDESGAWQIEQIVNRRNEYINFKGIDTQAAVTDMVSVLPENVQRAVEKFFEERKIDDVRSEASRAIGEVSSPARRPEERISMRPPGRPSLVLNDSGDEVKGNIRKVLKLGGRLVECIELKSAVIFRSGKDELGDKAIDQCEDFGGVVLGPTGNVIRVVGGDGVSATQAPASTARLAVATALTHSGSPKESIVAADACVQGSYEVSALIRELNSIGIPTGGARYRNMRKALDGSGGRGRIGATTLLVASVSGDHINIARLGDMGAGVVTSSGEIFVEAENVQTVPDQISLGVDLDTKKIAQRTLPFEEGSIGVVFSDGLLKKGSSTISPDAFLEKAAEYLAEPAATLSSVGKRLMAEMNGHDDGWLCLFNR